MLPFETPTIFEQLPRFIFKMPRVVTDQKSKFESDELFRRLSRESEVCVRPIPRIHSYLTYSAILMCLMCFRSGLPDIATDLLKNDKLDSKTGAEKDIQKR